MVTQVMSQRSGESVKRRRGAAPKTTPRRQQSPVTIRSLCCAVLACHTVSVADTVTVASTPSQYEWQLTDIARTVTTMGLVIEYRVMHYGIRPNSPA